MKHLLRVLAASSPSQANSFAFTADLDKIQRTSDIYLVIEDLILWFLRKLPRKESRSSTFAHPRPSAPSWLSAADILGPGPGLLVQHGQRFMDQAPAWAPRHSSIFKSRARGASSYKCVQICVRTT